MTHWNVLFYVHPLSFAVYFSLGWHFWERENWNQHANSASVAGSNHWRQTKFFGAKCNWSVHLFHSNRLLSNIRVVLLICSTSLRWRENGVEHAVHITNPTKQCDIRAVAMYRIDFDLANLMRITMMPPPSLLSSSVNWLCCVQLECTIPYAQMPSTWIE